MSAGVVAIGVGFVWSGGVARGVMDVSDWGNKGSVIKDEVDVVISCRGGSDGGSVAGIDWGSNS